MALTCKKLAFIFIFLMGSIKHSIQFGAFPSTAVVLKDTIWTPLQILRDTQDPSTLCISTSKSPRLAKDEPYASAVLKAWRDESKTWPSNHSESVGAPFAYQRKEDGAMFNGYLVAPASKVNNTAAAQIETIPVVILFHTGAGPQDIFLKWKADALVQKLQCAVFIADIISDGEGYAWSDRKRYEAARIDVLTAYEEKGQIARWKLRQTISAALDFLRGIDFVDADKMAGVGWCMGGHPILELGLMQEACVKSLVSYHGVLDGVKDHLDKPSIDSKLIGDRTRVLICNGEQDPFVSQQEVEVAKKILESSQGCIVHIMNFNGVKHGFTNPAQDFNPSDEFAYDENAANLSWEATLNLLRETIQ
jgi:dienelactone hydrolase